jgi:hypothetical protein
LGYHFVRFPSIVTEPPARIKRPGGPRSECLRITSAWLSSYHHRTDKSEYLADLVKVTGEPNDSNHATQRKTRFSLCCANDDPICGARHCMTAPKRGHLLELVTMYADSGRPHPGGDQVCLIGNVMCSALDAGADEEVIESARYALRQGMTGGGYIFSTSNCICTGMKPARYQLMLDVWLKEGNGSASRRDSYRASL